MEKEICHATLQKAVALLTRCQSEIQTWMARNKIYFNPTNPELLIGTRHHYSWVSFPGLSSDSLWSHEITLDSQSFPSKGQCSCLMFHFFAINNNEQKKSCTFARKSRKTQSRCCIEPGDMLYQGEWNEKMWAVLEEISSLSR